MQSIWFLRQKKRNFIRSVWHKKTRSESKLISCFIGIDVFMGKLCFIEWVCIRCIINYTTQRISRRFLFDEYVYGFHLDRNKKNIAGLSLPKTPYDAGVCFRRLHPPTQYLAKYCYQLLLLIPVIIEVQGQMYTQYFGDQRLIELTFISYRFYLFLMGNNTPLLKCSCYLLVFSCIFHGSEGNFAS